MALRDYQQEAFDSIKQDFNIPGASLVVMPTASGKSHVIAATAALSENTLIIQPSRELLQQNYEKLCMIVPKEDIGIFSASFNQKEIKKFTFATIQSIYKKPELFTGIKVVLMDECHGHAPRALSSMYSSFFSAIGNPKIFGFTATPYRLEPTYMRTKDGALIQVTTLKLINRMRNKEHKEMFWKRIIYTVSHKNLLDKGYLSPIEYINKPLVPYEEIPVNLSHSDYNLEEYSESIIGHEANILRTLSEAQKRYKSVLVFCPNTDMAERLNNIMVGSGIVLAKTDKKVRAETIKKFKSMEMKTVFNVGTLTTGFDHPALDCVVLLRPTRSLPLYNQMVGRLARIAPGKEKGTLIDLTGTSENLGSVESFEIYKNKNFNWDLKTSVHNEWHNTILFSRIMG